MKPPAFNYKNYEDAIADLELFKGIHETDLHTIAAMSEMIHDLRDELCLHCGRYKTAHTGACDGCRWKELKV